MRLYMIYSCLLNVDISFNVSPHSVCTTTPAISWNILIQYLYESFYLLIFAFSAYFVRVECCGGWNKATGLTGKILAKYITRRCACSKHIIIIIIIIIITFISVYVVSFCIREFRSLVIELVLATDMSNHFQQVKTMKSLLLLPDKWVAHVIITL